MLFWCLLLIAVLIYHNTQQNEPKKANQIHQLPHKIPEQL